MSRTYCFLCQRQFFIPYNEIHNIAFEFVANFSNLMTFLQINSQTETETSVIKEYAG